jgi:hypothetical protein
VHQPTDLRLGGGIHAWPLTAGVLLGGNLASRTVAAQERFDKRKADANNVGDRLLRASRRSQACRIFCRKLIE